MVVKERFGAKSVRVRNFAERLVASAIWIREDPRFLDAVYMANPSSFIDYKYGMPILKGFLKKNQNAPRPSEVAQTYDFESLSLLTYARSLLSQQALFFRGGSATTRAASYLRRVFDWG